MGFYDPKAQRTFCADCNPNAGEHNGSWKGGTESARCVPCGSEFEYYPSDKKGVYCSVCVAERDEFLGEPYRREANTVSTECQYCGEPMTVLESD